MRDEMSNINNNLPNNSHAMFDNKFNMFPSNSIQRADYELNVSWFCLISDWLFLFAVEKRA